LESGVGQYGAASIIIEDERASSGMKVCIRSPDHSQTSQLLAEDPYAGTATIMMGTDTKKDGHAVVEIHYNKHAMSIRLVEGG
jgi:hypothetical protein